MHRRQFALATAALAAIALVAPIPARAATKAAFTQQAYEAARDAGKPILIAVHADWCPICAKQKPILDSLTGQPAFRDLVVLVVDFDRQKDVLQAFGVTKQSTLIALHGKTERDRSVGVTSEDAIKALLAKTAA